MSDLIAIDSYEIKEAKTGHKVPVVNGVLIHSVYNPLREAESIVNQYKDQLIEKNDFLVLGLGFGYHIQAIIEELNKIGKTDYRISVIEPNDQVVKDCLKINIINSKQVKIYSFKTVDKLYRSQSLINALLKKPAVIAHAPSFNLYKDYFKNYLKFQAEDSIENLVSSIENERVKQCLSTFDKDLNIDQVNRTIHTSRKFKSEEELLLMAFDKLSSQIKVIEQRS